MGHIEGGKLSIIALVSPIDDCFLRKHKASVLKKGYGGQLANTNLLLTIQGHVHTRK